VVAKQRRALQAVGRLSGGGSERALHSLRGEVRGQALRAAQADHTRPRFTVGLLHGGAGEGGQQQVVLLLSLGRRAGLVVVINSWRAGLPVLAAELRHHGAAALNGLQGLQFGGFALPPPTFFLR
jgi:hypothetical protein